MANTELGSSLCKGELDKDRGDEDNENNKGGRRERREKREFGLLLCKREGIG